MISAVPQPSAVSRTICARQTCFCGLFRSATIAASCWRSAALNSTVIPARMRQIRTVAQQGESSIGLDRQILSTRLEWADPKKADIRWCGEDLATVVQDQDADGTKVGAVA